MKPTRSLVALDKIKKAVNAKIPRTLSYKLQPLVLSRLRSHFDDEENPMNLLDDNMLNMFINMMAKTDLN